jgi:hypothetical protein
MRALRRSSVSGVQVKGLVVHHAANERRAQRAAVADHGLDHFPEGQHPGQFAVVHHDQRTDVALRHGGDRLGKRLVG